MPRRVKTLVSAVLAHGAHPDSIWHRDASDFEWCKELGYGFTRRLGVYGAASDRILLWREERDAFGSDVGNRSKAFGSLLGGWGFGPRDGDTVMRVRDALREICCHDVIDTRNQPTRAGRSQNEESLVLCCGIGDDVV